MDLRNRNCKGVKALEGKALDDFVVKDVLWGQSMILQYALSIEDSGFRHLLIPFGVTGPGLTPIFKTWRAF